MTSPVDLLRIMHLSDSAFPSGAFAFSNGLEALVRDGRANGRDEIEALLRDQIAQRWLDIDRYYLSSAHEAAGNAEMIDALDADCEVTNTTPALRNASLAIGRSLLMSHARIGTVGVDSFRERIAAGSGKGHAAVVLGTLAYGAGLPRAYAEAGALHGQLAGYVSAAIRLGRIGALEAQGILSRTIAHVGHRLADPAPRKPAGFAPLIEIAAARPNGTLARLFAN